MNWQKVLITLTAILLLNSIGAKANITLEIEPADESGYITVDDSNFPKVLAKLIVKENGSQIAISKENILVIENNISTIPSECSNISNGTQKVSWYSKIRGTTTNYNLVTFVVTYKNEVITKSAIYFIQNTPQIRVSDINSDQINEYDYGVLDPQSNIKIRLSAHALTGKLNNDGNELPIRVDSIRTHSDYFSCEWLGSLMNHNQPPVSISSPSKYTIRVKFDPQGTEYRNDRLSIHYEGGAVENIYLKGNRFDITRKSILKVITPNGNENLTPCMDYKIQWTGQTAGYPVAVDYTTNGGTKWINIGSTLDSFLIWSVPDIITNTAKIRVSQYNNSPDAIPLTIDTSAVWRIAFNSTGDRLLAANRQAKIIEWNISTFKNTGIYTLPGSDNPNTVIKPNALKYFANGSKIILAYYYPNNSVRNDTLAIFENEKYTDNPVKIPLNNFYVKDIVVDKNNRFIALIPELGSQIVLLSTQDFSIIKTLDYQYPIVSFAINESQNFGAVALLNGEIKLINLDNYSTTKTYDFSYLPYLLEISLSADGKLLGLGCKAPVSTITSGNTNEIHVVDLETGYLVRSLKRTASNPIGLEFNAASNILVVGSEYNPKIALWDLCSDELLPSPSANTGMLTDIAFSPDGHIIATSSNSSDNLTVRTMTYNETDESDNYFNIIKPNVKLETINVDEYYIAAEKEYSFSTSMCNNGQVPLYLYSSSFKFGNHFSFKNTLTPDTLYPGECAKIDLIFNPLDSGKLYDTIVFNSCNQSYYLPIEGYGKPRNISFYTDPIDFGELCILDTLRKQVLYAKNNDPIPVIINSVTLDKYNSDFQLTSIPKDLVLQPSESFSIGINFIPLAEGPRSDKLIVYHSNQTKMTAHSIVQGVGLGTTLSLSHSNMYFIPEITKRKLTIKNKSINSVYIDNVVFKPEGIYTLVSTLPIEIQPETEIELELNCLDNSYKDDVIFKINALPCVAKVEMALGRYSASSNLTIPLVEADPRSSADIPLYFENIENHSYKGIRFFDGEININPRMFLPESIHSDYGLAKITRNEIINDRRIIGFRVEGDFTANGTAAIIHGVAGLAESDTSIINYSNSSLFWGSAVKTQTSSGLLKLINIQEDRRILHPEKQSYIQSISPNPNNGQFELVYFAQSDGIAKLELYDNLANLIHTLDNIPIQKNENIISVNANSFNVGNYRIVLKMNGSVDSRSVVIIK